MTRGSRDIEEGTELGLVGLTPDGVIESWSGGAERLTGYSREEAIGQHFSMFYTAEDRRIGQPEYYLRKARVEKVEVHSGWRIRKDGSQFWGDIRITALYAKSGTLIGYAKVMRDLTESRRNDAAQATFYSTFMHDFRLPVAAIKGFTELVHGAEPKDQDHFLDRVDDNADRMLVMAEDLVEHARDDSDQLTIMLEAIDLADLARHVAAGPVADTARIKVTSDRVVVMAETSSLHRVIANVLTNALKYSDPGSLISLTTDETETEGTLRVTDRGRGIDPDDLETVFLEFQRGRLARSDGGTGLGLASARELVQRLGGTMGIESEVGVGTTVVITLPKGDPDVAG
ncbi:MAG: PAS domain-containing sensor histidine kinase [Propionibacteriales bacterium]|nr:PAS domain-containing sensor histidine kinase [Propionibacteriales bacterium]